MSVLATRERPMMAIFSPVPLIPAAYTGLMSKMAAKSAGVTNCSHVPLSSQFEYCGNTDCGLTSP